MRGRAGASRGLPSDGLGRRQRTEIVRARRVQQCIVASLVMVALAPAAAYWLSSRRAPRAGQLSDGGALPPLDAIVVPGGGLTVTGDAPAWVRARLDRALELFAANRESYVILLSRGTPHKPPPLDPEGRPIDEAYVSAEYLRERSVPAQRLLQDTWSLDTIGNAAFLRFMHLEPRRLRRVAVVTNAFHMPRVAAIFDWVLGLPPVATRFDAHYVAVDDVGLTDEQLGARRAKEAASLDKLRVTIDNIRSASQLHGFLFEHHGSYATGASREPVSTELAASY
ncbi:hypothetical protein KFE25_007747 [Diacronema lutheri]|uniref:DUF218 domain-containing protein n=2 Tax=Diacronema lutheri TaxID=2081491 RepID=A0A8J5XRP3_DIALT|nr:hypothetical protein KFE25_007747 [Diacronema lutheri]